MRWGMRGDADTAMGGANHRFPSTRHSLLAEAIAGEASLPAREAIVEAYWKPVYKYIRWRWNAGNDAAKDLTQGFFAELFERDLLARFDPARAGFRTYIRLAVDGFIAHEREAAGRLKRGGGMTAVPMEDGAEVAAEGGSPEELFLREWQRQVFELAVGDLARRAEAAGKPVAWRIFEDYDLAEDERPTYDVLAARHGVAVTAVTNHLAWARRELRRAVLERVQSVTATGREMRAEARALFGGAGR